MRWARRSGGIRGVAVGVGVGGGGVVEDMVSGKAYGCERGGVGVD